MDKGESILQTTELEITDALTDSEMDSTLSDLSSTDAYSQSTEADSVLQDLDNISGFSSIKLEENKIGEESLASLSKTVKFEETEESRDLLQTITVSRQRTQESTRESKVLERVQLEREAEPEQKGAADLKLKTEVKVQNILKRIMIAEETADLKGTETTEQEKTKTVSKLVQLERKKTST